MRLLLLLLSVWLPLLAQGVVEPSSPCAPHTRCVGEGYVGSAACAACHPDSFAAWQGSDHRRAMQTATPDSVLGDFDGRRFTWEGVATRFYREAGRFMVQTAGPDGVEAVYPIAYTFGHYPLQQYLVEFPDGRLQALGIAWDSRPAREGGQRWFHLYPDEAVGPDHPLYWTGRYQRWNLQCAECHTTALHKGYDPDTDGYDTHASELTVACEACHGPAQRHLQWASQATPSAAVAHAGFTRPLTGDHSSAWHFADEQARIAQRAPNTGDPGMSVCIACHARRSTLSEGGAPGGPLEDSHLPALLSEPAYFIDGQQREEDFTWGSFRQSRMYAAGVTCLDCHDPHTLRTRAEGNALCLRCHRSTAFDTPEHHHHAPGSGAAECVACHAPTRDYMVVDARHDHSFRLPRPDLSQRLDTPNACTGCHTEQDAAWAASALDTWYGPAWRERPHFATTFAAVGAQGDDAWSALLTLARDPQQSAWVRASAWQLAAPLGGQWPGLAAQPLHDPDPSVRIAALKMLEAAPADERLRLAAPSLEDPVRGVRLEAASLLADWYPRPLPEATTQALARALDEYEAYLDLNADWPGVNINRGNLRLRQGRFDAAISAYRRAAQLEPGLAAAYLGLAEIYRQLGQDDRAEQALRTGVAETPDAAALHHALGLVLVRRHQPQQALEALAEAARLAPENTHYTLVQAVALHTYGQRDAALQRLRQALLQHPRAVELRDTLRAIEAESGTATATDRPSDTAQGAVGEHR